MIPWGWIAGGVAALVTANYARNKLNSRPRVGDVATVGFADLAIQQVPGSVGVLPGNALTFPVTITAITSLAPSGATAGPNKGISGTVAPGIPVKFDRQVIKSMTRNGVVVPNPAG